MPEAVEEVVARALARSPADRFVDTSQFAQALQAAVGAQPAVPAEPARATRHPAFRRRILLAAAGALVAAAVLLGLYRGLRRAPEVTLDRNLLAIAPFDVLDPSLQLWREGLGDILSRSLDAAGPLRTVSPTVALRRWEGRADRASAEALGRRTGAGLVVFGTVVPKGRDSVTLRAGVLDAVSGSGQREVEVSGESARIGELADSLGIRILQALGRSRAIGSVRQVSMGSRSLPALKAFLQGEQFYRRGLWDSALARYDQAIAADSTFALALSRMKWVLYWHPPTAGAYLPGEEYARRSTLYNHGLSPRESLLIVADSFSLRRRRGDRPESLRRLQLRSLAALEEAVRRYPGDPEAWYVLGETRMHAPFPIGTPPATTFETFSRTIALDSGFAPAYEHMADLAIRLGRPELARRFAAAYLSLYPDAGSTSHSAGPPGAGSHPVRRGGHGPAGRQRLGRRHLARRLRHPRLRHRLRGNPGPAAPQDGRTTPERGRRRGLGARFADVATVSGRRTRLPGPPPRGLPDRPPPAARPGRFEMEPVHGPIPRSGPAWGSPGLRRRARLRARARADRAVGL